LPLASKSTAKIWKVPGGTPATSTVTLAAPGAAVADDAGTTSCPVAMSSTWTTKIVALGGSAAALVDGAAVSGKVTSTLPVAAPGVGVAASAVEDVELVTAPLDDDAPSPHPTLPVMSRHASKTAATPERQFLDIADF
jgi:hypothetical protein